jgi:hypothetical protein
MRLPFFRKRISEPMKIDTTDPAIESTGSDERAEARGPGCIVAGPSTSIVTRMIFAASPGQVWDGLMFYEQILDRAPLVLRLLLPSPIGVETRKLLVGDTARCLYEDGFLMKRVTRIDQDRCYEFEVSEQNLPFGGGMKLRGGCYELRRLREGCTEVSLTTRYVSPKRPRWFWKPIEAAVCHAFHRHVLRAMRRKTQTGNPVVTAWNDAPSDAPGSRPGAPGTSAEIFLSTRVQYQRKWEP